MTTPKPPRRKRSKPTSGRAFSEADYRAAGWATVKLRLRPEVLERLRAYQQERGFRSLNEALGELLGGATTATRTS